MKSKNISTKSNLSDKHHLNDHLVSECTKCIESFKNIFNKRISEIDNIFSIYKLKIETLLESKLEIFFQTIMKFKKDIDIMSAIILEKNIVIEKMASILEAIVEKFQIVIENVETINKKSLVHKQTIMNLCEAFEIMMAMQSN